MNLQPVTLSGRRIRLEPLRSEHAEDLAVAAADDQIWTYLDEPTPWDLSSVRAFIADAASEQERGARLAFAIITREPGTRSAALATSTSARVTEVLRSAGPGSPRPPGEPA
jgi:RimJ/RimL family protein N-acetyltransferase